MISFVVQTKQQYSQTHISLSHSVVSVCDCRLFCSLTTCVIHPSITAYPWSGCGDNRFQRETQTKPPSFPAILPSSSLGLLSLAQAQNTPKSRRHPNQMCKQSHLTPPPVALIQGCTLSLRWSHPKKEAHFNCLYLLT